ncbi:hypothetical protein [uncultured Chryseobacterium sp.]|jgi:hypothetical protein|uniref:hypothetical protein n=1 Tax=uncultured Chryseobacterium sp. TaxID=259322 RepID=UPI00261EEE4D|nr:hypothetical protein [uncultured Chryseobacterium sp.]
MLSTNRKFHFIGELNIKKSKLLKPSQINPENDEVNWMFIALDDARYSFVYKIEDPQNAKYDFPFSIKLAFTFYNLIEDKLELNKIYPVLRGEEKVGIVKLKSYADHP